MTTGKLAAWGPAQRIAALEPRVTRASVVPDNLKLVKEPEFKDLRNSGSEDFKSSDPQILTSSNFSVSSTEYPANGSFNRPYSRSGFVACMSAAEPRTKKNYGQASRLISIGQLNVSPRLHTRPITW